MCAGRSPKSFYLCGCRLRASHRRDAVVDYIVLGVASARKTNCTLGREGDSAIQLSYVDITTREKRGNDRTYKKRPFFDYKTAMALNF